MATLTEVLTHFKNEGYRGIAMLPINLLILAGVEEDQHKHLLQFKEITEEEIEGIKVAEQKLGSWLNYELKVEEDIAYIRWPQTHYMKDWKPILKVRR